MEGIAARIAPIFHWTAEKTRDFMNVLNGTNTDVTAGSFFEQLTRLSKSQIPTVPLGEGAYGKVTTDAAGTYAYKQIQIGTGDRSEHSLLTEAFIQAVLCTDPDPRISSNICKVHNVYRFMHLRPYIIIKMDNIGTNTTIHDMIYSKSADSRLNYIKNIIRQLITLLGLLQTNYMFQHSDLHIKNLAVKDDHIQLIDFGRAQITIDGQKYATNFGKTAAYNTRYNLKTILGESNDSHLSLRQYTKYLSPTLQSFTQGIISQIEKTDPELLAYIDSWDPPTAPASANNSNANNSDANNSNSSPSVATNKKSTRKRSVRKRSTRKRSTRV